MTVEANEDGMDTEDKAVSLPDGDRGISPVKARTGASRILVGAAVLGVAGLALVPLLVADEDEEETLLQVEDEEFTTGVERRENDDAGLLSPKRQAVVAPEPASVSVAAGPPGPPGPPGGAVQVALALEREKQLAQLAAAQVERENQILRERRASPMVLVDKSVDGGSSGSASITTNGVSGSGIGGARSGHKAHIYNDMGVVVAEGTFIRGVLETAISSDLPGAVRAVIADDVYSADGSRVVLHRGARLVGEYASDIGGGQSRVGIVWDRVITSSGISIDLASTGTDSVGRAGVDGTVKRHFWKRFGSSILLTLIDGTISAAVAAAGDGNGSDIAVSTGGSLSQGAAIALNNSINIQPTISVKRGEVIHVFVASDLDFSSVYERQ